MPSPEIFATLDIRTLILVTALIYLMCTLTQGFIYLNNRDEPGLGKFVIAHALINLGLILIAARGLIPDLLSMVIANASILSGLTFLHHAIRCFYQRPTSLRATAVVFVLSCLAFFHFGQISPDYAIRVLLFSLPFIVLCILIAREFFLPTEHEIQPAPRWVNATLFTLLALLFTVRLLVIKDAHLLASSIIRIGTESGLLQASPLSSLTWLVLIASFGYWNVGLLLLVSQKFLARQNRLAITDGLTGILNRRGFELMAEKILLTRTASSNFMLLLDLDHFKQVNDRHGHEAGDEVLRQFVLLLNQQLRKSDLTGRIGGEEFAVLLRESTEAQAWSVAERVRTALQQMPIRHRDTTIEVTVSIGVAQSGADGESFAELFRTADQRLYQAKRSGRNRTLFRETADVATP